MPLHYYPDRVILTRRNCVYYCILQDVTVCTTVYYFHSTQFPHLVLVVRKTKNI